MKKVLIIDDEPHNIEALEEHFKKSKVPYDTASSIAEALEYLKNPENKYGAIICDNHFVDNDFVLNASGKSNIDTGGISKFSARNANYDVADVAPTWSASGDSYLYAKSADTAGTSEDPKLVVNHSVAITFIPRAIIY